MYYIDNIIKNTLYNIKHIYSYRRVTKFLLISQSILHTYDLNNFDVELIISSIAQW